MRIDLPMCNFKNCHWCQDGNCVKVTRDYCEYNTLQKEIKQIKSDTVQKMQELIHTNLPKVYGSLPHSQCFFNIVDRSAKEILEENNNV